MLPISQSIDYNNSSYILNSEMVQSLDSYSIFADTSKSNLNDHIEKNEISTTSVKELLSNNLCSVMVPTQVDSEHCHYPCVLSTDKSYIDTLDSGISSPTFLQNDNLDAKQKIITKDNAEFDTRDDYCQATSLTSAQPVRPQKPSFSEPSQGGIGGIVSRIRSLSIGMRPRFYSNSRKQSDEGCSMQCDNVSPVRVSPDHELCNVKVPGPDSRPKSNTSVNKTSRSNRKWMRMSHSISCDVDSFNVNEYPQNMNRMETFLSGHIDTSTPNGALLAVINQGLRKVSESDKYLLFSKCPLRSPVDFLDFGMEHLGDSDILITVLHHYTCYDLMPENGKLLILDSTLPIHKAFVAFEHHNVNSAPIWSNHDQSFIGTLSKDNQMYLLLLAYQFREETRANSDTYMDTISKECLANCIEQTPTKHQLVWANPEDTICSVIKRLKATSSSEILIIDGQRSGNALYVLDHRKILSFMLSASLYGLPLPSVLKNMVCVTELMMNRTVLDQYKVYPSTDLSTLLKVMDANVHHCALVCTKKTACSSCQCTDACIGLLTVDHISHLISQSRHCDPSYKVEFILEAIPERARSLVYCQEKTQVIHVIRSIIDKKTPFIFIRRDCCKDCVHAVVSSRELLNYIVKHDNSSTGRENTYVPEHRKSFPSLCCETIPKKSDKNLSGVCLDEKEEDVFNMEVT